MSQNDLYYIRALLLFPRDGTRQFLHN